MQRNSHPSALAHQSFLRDKIADLIDQHFWIVLPFDFNAVFAPVPHGRHSTT